MRLWGTIIGMIAALALQCGPVAAHGKGHATQAVVPVHQAQTPKADDMPLLGVCEIDPRRLVQRFPPHQKARRASSRNPSSGIHVNVTQRGRKAVQYPDASLRANRGPDEVV